MMNLTLLVDFYEFTMANAHFACGNQGRIAYFDMFYRSIPDSGGFSIMAGVAQLIEYIEQLSFADDDIEFLRSKSIFSENFLQYLRTLRNTCDIWAIPEGTPIFPGEPIVVVRGDIIFTQFIETMLLLTINHQTLIATKANRIVRSANGRPVMEFGTRRAHGAMGASLGARAAYIGGCVGTSCTLAEKEYMVPALGTMSHSWVLMFDSEYEAFCAYAKVYPDNCILLVDTYNTLKKGVPNAIKVFDTILKPLGKRPKGIRIDSGDIAYLSTEARKALDSAGYTDCQIIASNSLDEYIIRDLLIQGAPIDSFGVGERLITSRSEPVFGGVYKLAAIQRDNCLLPRIKISENVSKVTLPGFKTLYRIYDNDTNIALADLVCLYDEQIDCQKPLEIFDPIHTWKRKTITNFYVRKLLIPIFENGKCVYKSPEISEIREYCKQQIKTLWPASLRFENPHKHYVDLSHKLWQIQKDLLLQGE